MRRQVIGSKASEGYLCERLFARIPRVTHLSSLLVAVWLASGSCSLSSSAQSVSGWKTITTDGNQCQFSVPPSWTVTPTGSVVLLDPNDGSGITAIFGVDHMTSWQDKKHQVKNATGGPGAQIVEESDTRLWVEYTPINGAGLRNIDVVRPGMDYDCEAHLTSIRSASRAKLDPFLKQMVNSLVVLNCCSSASPQAASGWKTLATEGKQCQVSIPPNWHDFGSRGPGLLFGTTSEEENVMCSVAAIPTQYWQAQKSKIKQEMIGPNSKVIEDSDNLLWIENPVSKGRGDTRIYVARRENGYYCIATLGFPNPGSHPNLDPIFKQVATSVAAVK